MKIVLSLLGFLTAGVFTQAHRPTTLPSHPVRPAHPGYTTTNPPPRPMPTANPLRYRYYCNQYRNQTCKRDVVPTCGWYDTKLVICHTFPCASHFSNPCMACNNKYVKYITCENCPHTNTPVTKLNYADARTNAFPTCINHI